MSEVRNCVESLMRAFLKLRRACGNNVPVKYDPTKPTKNLCLESSSGMCNISDCPLLR